MSKQKMNTAVFLNLPFCAVVAGALLLVRFYGRDFWKRNEGGCWLWEMEPRGRRPQSWEQDEKSLESEAIEIRCGRT
ncbi:transmembrane protein, putative [Medicago truncatula]|uniref:Transmembrane protein, putative n=1 Tax=Medicago truncatula TaxID=3880 RepID=G7IVJ3_MEDTR|nr:transmembrane protein, putative [Medicago truncatula]